MSYPVKVALQSNNFELSDSSSRLGELKSTKYNAPIEILQSAYERDGYILIRNFFDPNKIMNLRSLFLTELISKASGKSSLMSEASRYNYSGISKKAINSAIQKFVTSAEYLALINDPKLKNLVSAVLKEPVSLYKRKLVRIKFKNDKNGDTGGHYDRIYFRNGSDRFLSCWIPLGDISMTMGGLTYLEKSSNLGKDIEMTFEKNMAKKTTESQTRIRSKGMGGRGWLDKNLSRLANKTDTRWLITDYKAGDLVLHNPYIIHASLTNIDSLDRIRLSTDIRYFAANSYNDSRWQKPWNENDKL